jgi:uncharacterized protein YcfJ
MEVTMIGARVTSSLVVAALVPSMALAEHRYQYAKVLASDPIYETVSYSVPVEQCRDETVAYHEAGGRSATGPILGAIIGGALGNAVGHKKRNKQVGTAVGAILGGSIGADVARRQRSYGENVRYSTREVCSVRHEQRYEERLAGYRVTYRYGGETYTTDMDRDPGSSLRVQVRVTPVG